MDKAGPPPRRSRVEPSLTRAGRPASFRPCRPLQVFCLQPFVEASRQSVECAAVGLCGSLAVTGQIDLLLCFERRYLLSRSRIGCFRQDHGQAVAFCRDLSACDGGT